MSLIEPTDFYDKIFEEIKKLLLQTAIYSGVPDANTAFRIAQGVFAEDEPV